MINKVAKKASELMKYKKTPAKNTSTAKAETKKTQVEPKPKDAKVNLRSSRRTFSRRSSRGRDFFKARGAKMTAKRKSPAWDRTKKVPAKAAPKATKAAPRVRNSQGYKPKYMSRSGRTTRSRSQGTRRSASSRSRLRR